MTEVRIRVVVAQTAREQFWEGLRGQGVFFLEDGRA